MKTIAEFKILHHQFLNEKSELIQKPKILSSDKTSLLKLYRLMSLLRQFDAKAIVLQRTGKLGTFPSSLGQEAVSVGYGAAMAESDVLCPYYRDTGALFARGILPEEVLSMWGGDERGNNFKASREDFPLSVPIATQCLHATGVAYALKYRQQKRVAVASIGEGGTSEGDFYEALNLAGAWQLPVVFVVNNNQWAISVSREVQTHCPTIAQKAIAAGFEGCQVDGNDVIAVYEIMRQALDKAKNGGGPTLIEAVTYRLCDHTTADDASRYVDPQKLKHAWELEPIKRLRDYLIAQQFWDETQEKALQEALAMEVDKAVTNYMNNPAQPIESMIDYLYKELPEALLEQREQMGERHA